MKIGLLIIASEVLDGKIQDLNTKFLSEYLYEHELELTTSITVRDNIKHIEEGLELLLSKTDFIITSGGLGPTKDDLTKSTLAHFLNRKIEYSENAHEIATANYARFNREFPGKEHLYSELPEGFIPLNNAAGFAPGYFAEHSYQGNTKFLLALPGVPRELKSMLIEHAPQLLLSKIKKPEFIENIIYRTKGVPEEKIFFEIDKTLWDKLSQFGSVSSLPISQGYGVDIGINLKASSLQELDFKKNLVLKVMNESPVKKYVWHIGKETVEELVVELARSKNFTFGFAESCTGGLCSHRVTNISGSSQCFLGSVICYSEEVKIHQLNVQKHTIDQFNIVSEEVAKEMAQGLVKNLNLDIGLSLTGIAGPNGGTTERPVGLVCIALATKNQVFSWRYEFKGDRELLKNRFSQVGLFHLHDYLKSL